MELQLHTYESQGATIVEIGGELELNNAPGLREELRRVCESKRVCCVVDMSRVTFIDSTGVGVLVGALKRARENGGSLTLACPQPRVRRVFEITGLLGALPIHDSLDAARGACSTISPAVKSDKAKGDKVQDDKSQNVASQKSLKTVEGRAVKTRAAT